MVDGHQMRANSLTKRRELDHQPAPGQLRGPVKSIHHDRPSSSSSRKMKTARGGGDAILQQAASALAPVRVMAASVENRRPTSEVTPRKAGAAAAGSRGQQQADSKSPASGGRGAVTSSAEMKHTQMTSLFAAHEARVRSLVWREAGVDKVIRGLPRRASSKPQTQTHQQQSHFAAASSRSSFSTTAQQQLAEKLRLDVIRNKRHLAQRTSNRSSPRTQRPPPKTGPFAAARSASTSSHAGGGDTLSSSYASSLNRTAGGSVSTYPSVAARRQQGLLQPISAGAASNSYSRDHSVAGSVPRTGVLVVGTSSAASSSRPQVPAAAHRTEPRELSGRGCRGKQEDRPSSCSSMSARDGSPQPPPLDNNFTGPGAPPHQLQVRAQISSGPEKARNFSELKAGWGSKAANKPAVKPETDQILLLQNGIENKPRTLYGPAYDAAPRSDHNANTAALEAAELRVNIGRAGGAGAGQGSPTSRVAAGPGAPAPLTLSEARSSSKRSKEKEQAAAAVRLELLERLVGVNRLESSVRKYDKVPGPSPVKFPPPVPDDHDAGSTSVRHQLEHELHSKGPMLADIATPADSDVPLRREEQREEEFSIEKVYGTPLDYGWRRSGSSRVADEDQHRPVALPLRQPSVVVAKHHHAATRGKADPFDPPMRRPRTEATLPAPAAGERNDQAAEKASKNHISHSRSFSIEALDADWLSPNISDQAELFALSAQAQVHLPGDTITGQTTTNLELVSRSGGRNIDLQSWHISESEPASQHHSPTNRSPTNRSPKNRSPMNHSPKSPVSRPGSPLSTKREISIGKGGSAVVELGDNGSSVVDLERGPQSPEPNEAPGLRSVATTSLSGRRVPLTTDDLQPNERAAFDQAEALGIAVLGGTSASPPRRKANAKQKQASAPSSPSSRRGETPAGSRQPAELPTTGAGARRTHSGPSGTSLAPAVPRVQRPAPIVTTDATTDAALVLGLLPGGETSHDQANRASLVAVNVLTAEQPSEGTKAQNASAVTSSGAAEAAEALYPPSPAVGGNHLRVAAPPPLDSSGGPGSAASGSPLTFATELSVDLSDEEDASAVLAENATEMSSSRVVNNLEEGPNPLVLRDEIAHATSEATPVPPPAMRSGVQTPQLLGSRSSSKAQASELGPRFATSAPASDAGGAFLTGDGERGGASGAVVLTADQVGGLLRAGALRASSGAPDALLDSTTPAAFVSAELASTLANVIDGVATIDPAAAVAAIAAGKSLSAGEPAASGSGSDAESAGRRAASDDIIRVASAAAVEARTDASSAAVVGATPPPRNLTQSPGPRRLTLSRTLHTPASENVIDIQPGQATPEVFSEAEGGASVSIEADGGAAGDTAESTAPVGTKTGGRGGGKPVLAPAAGKPVATSSKKGKGEMPPAVPPPKGKAGKGSSKEAPPVPKGKGTEAPAPPTKGAAPPVKGAAPPVKGAAPPVKGSKGAAVPMGGDGAGKGGKRKGAGKMGAGKGSDGDESPSPEVKFRKVSISHIEPGSLRPLFWAPVRIKDDEQEKKTIWHVIDENPKRVSSAVLQHIFSVKQRDDKGKKSASASSKDRAAKLKTFHRLGAFNDAHQGEALYQKTLKSTPNKIKTFQDKDARAVGLMKAKLPPIKTLRRHFANLDGLDSTQLGLIRDAFPADDMMAQLRQQVEREEARLQQENLALIQQFSKNYVARKVRAVEERLVKEQQQAALDGTTGTQGHVDLTAAAPPSSSSVAGGKRRLEASPSSSSLFSSAAESSHMESAVEHQQPLAPNANIQKSPAVVAAADGSPARNGGPGAAADVLCTKRPLDPDVAAFIRERMETQTERRLRKYQDHLLDEEKLDDAEDVDPSDVECTLELSTKPVLEPVERYCVELLAQVPGFRLRLRVWLCVQDFGESYAECEANALYVLRACELLQRDPALVCMFNILVHSGNVLNAGSAARERADGFALEILTNLKSVKTTKDRLTDLELLRASAPEDADLITDSRRPTACSTEPIIEPGRSTDHQRQTQLVDTPLKKTSMQQAELGQGQAQGARGAAGESSSAISSRKRRARGNEEIDSLADTDSEEDKNQSPKMMMNSDERLVAAARITAGDANNKEDGAPGGAGGGSDVSGTNTPANSSPKSGTASPKSPGAVVVFAEDFVSVTQDPAAFPAVRDFCDFLVLSAGIKQVGTLFRSGTQQESIFEVISKAARFSAGELKRDFVALNGRVRAVGRELASLPAAELDEVLASKLRFLQDKHGDLERLEKLLASAEEAYAATRAYMGDVNAKREYTDFFRLFKDWLRDLEDSYVHVKRTAEKLEKKTSSQRATRRSSLAGHDHGPGIHRKLRKRNSVGF